jgi:hypothetical protein
MVITWFLLFELLTRAKSRKKIEKKRRATKEECFVAPGLVPDSEHSVLRVKGTQRLREVKASVGGPWKSATCALMRYREGGRVREGPKKGEYYGGRGGEHSGVQVIWQINIFSFRGIDCSRVVCTCVYYILFNGIHTLCLRVTRGYGDPPPLSTAASRVRVLLNDPWTCVSY